MHLKGACKGHCANTETWELLQISEPRTSVPHLKVRPKKEDLLIIEASRSHWDTPHSVGLLCGSDQPIAKICLKKQTTLAKERHPCPGGILFSSCLFRWSILYLWILPSFIPLTIHIIVLIQNTQHKYPLFRWISKPQFHQASGRQPTP
jgi:hypothetical protein